MQRIIEINGWQFEVTQVTARKCEVFGQPYSAIANVRFVNGKCFVEGLLNASQVSLARQDFRAIDNFAKAMGVNDPIEFVRFKHDG